MIPLCPLLFVTLHMIAFSHSVDLNQTLSNNTVCQFTISNNDTLFKKLSKHFDKKSRTIIIEYTIKLDNGSSEFNLYQGSNTKAFQPWRWYRTQGAGNSHVLLTYDFYFGILKSILTLGIRQFEIKIDINEFGCSNKDSENFDLLIRDILLQDFKISGNSTYRVYPKSDDVEVCTARIEETSDEHGELVFRCCSFDSEKKIFCDDKSMNIWGYALNLVIIIVSIFLVVGFLWFVLKENKMELYEYSSADVLSVNITEEAVEKVGKLNGMKGYHLTDGALSVTVKKLTLQVAKHQIYNPFDEVKSLREMVKAMLREKNDNKDSATKKNENMQKNDNKDGATKQIGNMVKTAIKSFLTYIKAKIDKCPNQVKQYVKNFVIMVVLTLPSLMFLCAMILDRFWYQELIEAYIERGLQGPFYFQWSKFIEVQRILVGVLIVWYFIGLVLYTICGEKMRCAVESFISHLKPEDESKDTGEKKLREKFWLILTLFFSIPFCLFLFIGAHFILNLLVMMIFTVIVQTEIFSIVVQTILTLFIYGNVYYEDYHKRHNSMKSCLISLFKDGSMYDRERNHVSEITSNSLERKFSENKFTKETNEKKPKPTISVEEERLILNLNCPALFTNKHDVCSVSHNFLFDCCKMDCEGTPKKLNIFKILLLLIVTITFIALVFLIVKAFGDIYSISPSNSFVFSFVTSLVPLILKYLGINSSSEKKIQKKDRRFQEEIVKKINTFHEKLTIVDMEGNPTEQTRKENLNRDGSGTVQITDNIDKQDPTGPEKKCLPVETKSPVDPDGVIIDTNQGNATEALNPLTFANYHVEYFTSTA